MAQDVDLFSVSRKAFQHSPAGLRCLSLCLDDVAQIHPEDVEDFCDSCELTQRGQTGSGYVTTVSVSLSSSDSLTLHFILSFADSLILLFCFLLL